jgi:hypothetical protein
MPRVTVATVVQPSPVARKISTCPGSVGHAAAGIGNNRPAHTSTWTVRHALFAARFVIEVHSFRLLRKTNYSSDHWLHRHAMGTRLLGRMLSFVTPVLR